jgi:hypothetical protein
MPSVKHSSDPIAFLALLLMITTITSCSTWHIEEQKRLVDYLDLLITPTPTSQIVTATTSPPATILAAPTAVRFESGGKIYRNSQGLFDFSLPEGWMVLREDDASVEFANFNEDAIFYAFVTNTGLELDKESFERFVEAQERNLFSAYVGYQETERQFDQDGIDALVVKRLLFDGQEQGVVSLYAQSDQAVLTLNLWVAPFLIKSYLGPLKKFFLEIRFYPNEVADQPVYRWTYEFRSDNNLYSMLIPLQWKNEQVVNNKAQVNRFIAPDIQAVIQCTLYDDGVRIGDQDAGFITLELLRADYGDHLSVSEDRFLAGGSERLTWNTGDGEISGVTFFDSRESTLVIQTMTYRTTQKVIYQDLYQILASSFRYLR